MVLCIASATEEEPPHLLVLQRWLKCELLKLVTKSQEMTKILTIIQDGLPPSEKDNHRLLVGESEMLPKSAVHLTGQEDEND